MSLVGHRFLLVELVAEVFVGHETVLVPGLGNGSPVAALDGGVAVGGVVIEVDGVDAGDGGGLRVDGAAAVDGVWGALVPGGAAGVEGAVVADEHVAFTSYTGGERAEMLVEG